jgi:hypothetical protein
VNDVQGDSRSHARVLRTLLEVPLPKIKPSFIRVTRLLLLSYHAAYLVLDSEHVCNSDQILFRYATKAEGECSCKVFCAT